SVLVKAEVDGETVYLNGSTHYAELGTSSFHRRPELDLKSGKIGKVQVASSKKDRSHNVIEISIAANGETGMTFSTKKHGTAFESFHRTYAEMTPEKRRRHYLELVSAISQSATAVTELVTDYSLYPGRRSFSIAADRYAVADGDYLYFNVPAGLGGLIQYRSSERTLPLAWKRYVDHIIEVNMILPDGYEPVIMPKDFSWMAPGGGLIEVAVDYSERANAIRMVFMADLKPALIPAADFPDIIEAGRKLAHPDMHTILLKRTE
ncbi:MAG TPA: hypothetical protein VIR77_01755, partial [Pontiella sp.]